MNFFMQHRLFLKFSYICIAIALLLNLLSLLWRSPLSMTIFFGIGLPLGILGLILYFVVVLMDLRARKLL